jgi:thymidylate synthase
MVNAWNVGELDQMVLPPCHNLWQMYSVEKENKRHLSIMVNIRSNDVPLGLPFNIASYGLLLEIIAKLTNMIPDELIINIGDAHIYLNQMNGIEEQLTREPFELPRLVISNQVNFSEGIDEFLNSCLITDFQLENYKSHPSIKMPLSN